MKNVFREKNDFQGKYSNQFEVKMQFFKEIFKKSMLF